MDPDATLAVMLEDARAILSTTATAHDRAVAAEALATRVEDLHGWIARGGFLPAAWMPALDRRSAA